MTSPHLGGPSPTDPAPTGAAPAGSSSTGPSTPEPTATGSALRTYTRTAERASAEVISCYSTSFGAATRLLGARHRRHVRNVYALVRVADEIVDGVCQQAGLDTAAQEDVLEQFIAETHRGLDTGYSSNLVVHAFAHTARAAGFGRDLVDPFFASMRSDLHHDDAAGLDEQAHDSYVHGSAEVVGLMCLAVFVREEHLDPATRSRLEHGAARLGAAFQDVNFLRDLADDTDRLGRSYLGPAHRLTDADRDRIVSRIRDQLADAEAVIGLLPIDSRSAVRSAAGLFAALADRLSRTPVEDLYRRRVRVPDLRKAAIIAEAVGRTWRERR
ncbi:phytoene synthase [Acidipropionibacterium acidipropionici]|uniref:phytoene/squalene synthase family protein n=1 Tax=Acidipropionibacterium acidipropionici TaxID=1748 RepID=UPI0009EF5812|nr:squalene/phytoene synthase family protein [Acidipropionibacterium acidipropionici]AZP36713.1 phytoene synthase [Acidipropionibacterium acidipropionici]